jgi:hypothetical protein
MSVYTKVKLDDAFFNSLRNPVPNKVKLMDRIR